MDDPPKENLPFVQMSMAGLISPMGSLSIPIGQKVVAPHSSLPNIAANEALCVRYYRPTLEGETRSSPWGPAKFACCQLLPGVQLKPLVVDDNDIRPRHHQ